MHKLPFLSFIHNSLNSGKANNGILFVIAIMATIISFSYLLMGGTIPDSPEATTEEPKKIGKQEIIFEQVPDPQKKNLQLQTFTVKNTCEDKIAVDFLIDVSGSMNQNNKIGKTKNALNAFASRMTDSSVIGMQVFSSPDNVREIIPLSLYKDVKVQVRNTITTLNASGWTTTRSAFELAHQKLAEAKSQNKFPDYKYNLVFLSDGVPEMEGAYTNPDNCLAISGTRCFAKEQDPRGTPTNSTNIATQIKSLPTDIYSIAITSSFDTGLKNELIQLLKDVASDPDTTFFYESVDGNDLTTVLDYVLKSICAG